MALMLRTKAAAVCSLSVIGAIYSLKSRLDFPDRNPRQIPYLDFRNRDPRSFLQRVFSHRHARRISRFRHRESKLDVVNRLKQERNRTARKRWLATDRLGKRAEPVAQERAGRDAEPSCIALEMIERRISRASS